MNATYTYTHPYIDTQVLDQSAGKEVSNLDLPLHKPLIFLRAAKGRSEPYWCNGSQAIAEYGEQTFDQYERFYRNEQYYLMNAFYPNQACFVMRIIPDDAHKSSMVIEALLTSDVDIPQYKLDEFGNFIYGADGQPIQDVDAMMNPIFEKGVKIRYTKRQMTDEEIAENVVKVRTFEVDGEQFTTYPVVHCIYKYAGAEGDRSGFRLSCKWQDQNSDLVEATGALLWTFVPMMQPYNSNIANVIPDIYKYTATQMSMKPDAIDPYTKRRMYADDTINRLYYKSTIKEYILPYDLKFYSDNIKMIGDKVAQYENTNPFIQDGWYVDILTLTDNEGHPYKHAQLDLTSFDPTSFTGFAGSGTSPLNNAPFVYTTVNLNDLSIQYLEGGSDGDISDEKFEEQIQQILKGNRYPELINTFRYPITHLYDVGYTIETKFAMSDFMAKQKRCKIMIAAQDANRHLYNMDEAVSLAAALRARVAITPESEFYGTPAMRATIFAQSGYVNDTTIGNIIPMTYWIANKRANFHNGIIISDSWTDYPNNVVDIYRKENFTPYDPDQKELLWDGAANYFQYSRMNEKFIPSIRTIYKTQSSMLSDEEYTDACVYLMYICDMVWVYHVGKTGIKFAALKDRIEKDIVKYAYRAFGDRYPVTATVYVTEDDVSRKDSLHIDTVLLGYRPYRRWFNTIIVRGEDVQATVSKEI